MKKYNFSATISVMSVLLVVVVVMNLALMLITMKSLTKNSIELYEDEFQSDVERLNDNLNAIHSMMLAELTSDTELDFLLEEEDNRNLTISEYATIKRVNRLMSNWSRDLGYDVCYAIYYPTNKIEMNSCITSEEFSIWRTIRDPLFVRIQNMDYKIGWQVMKFGEKNYLVDILQKNTITIICYIDLEKMITYLGNDIYGDDYYFAAYQESVICEGENAVTEDGIDIRELNKGSTKIKDNMVISHQNLQERVDLLLVIHNYNYQLGIIRIQIVFWVILVVVIILVIAFIGMINRTILHPIQRFNEKVESLKNNETYDLEAHYQIKELENASDFMNIMVQRIKKLKIDIYEKTLEQQKTNLDFLSLQIKPHFYLNCLNIIHSMAQMHQFEQIQKLIQCISVYLRYLFKSSNELVTIEDEVGHIEKYLEISKIRYQEGFSYEIELEDEVLKAKLPPLILQTFVENALKHTINWEDDIELKITGYVKEQAVITIEDTGEGFDEEILRRLRKHEDISEGEHRIGIMNAIARMAMVFGDNGEISFQNKPNGGARVTITFPYSGIAEKEQAEKTVFEERG